jgi:hypothetical protein
MIAASSTIVINQFLMHCTVNATCVLDISSHAARGLWITPCLEEISLQTLHVHPKVLQPLVLQQSQCMGLSQPMPRVEEQVAGELLEIE